ncbi:MAG TPA: hypothetical protein VFP35_03530 [Candidatus Saccharimonadales bacterium]|nr:hypothetical protein [Candidatus Saccharimonadales bacterium]
MSTENSGSRLDEIYFLKTEDAADLSSANPLARWRAFDHLPDSLSPADIGYIAQHVHRTHYYAGERRIRAYQRRAIKSIGDLSLSRTLQSEESAPVADIATAASAAAWLERGSLLSRFYARRLRAKIETEIVDFSAKLDSPQGQESL